MNANKWLEGRSTRKSLCRNSLSVFQGMITLSLIPRMPLNFAQKAVASWQPKIVTLFLVAGGIDRTWCLNLGGGVDLEVSG